MASLINDENKNAQFAAIQNDRLIVGQSIELIKDESDSETLGTQPSLRCKESGDFEDLDGEGVAYAAPYFYVVGSHGCSQNLVLHPRASSGRSAGTAG